MQRDCPSVGGVLTTASCPDCVREEMVIVDLWYTFRLVSGEIAGFACEKMKSLKVDGRVAEEWSA